MRISAPHSGIAEIEQPEIEQPETEQPETEQPETEQPASELPTIAAAPALIHPTADADAANPSVEAPSAAEPVHWPAFDRGSSVFDTELIRRFQIDRLLAGGWMPVRTHPAGFVIVAVVGVPDATRVSAITAALQHPVQFEIAEPWELRKALLEIFPAEVADSAANKLWHSNPALSARIVFSSGQKVGLSILVALVILGLVLKPSAVIVLMVGAASIAFLASTAFKFVVAMLGARFDIFERITPAEVAELADELLPRYTVLVPVFRESNIVGQLVKNLGGIDYPVDRLEVLILIEEEDDETRDALALANPPSHFHVVTIPRGAPQTKPRACNVGLAFATGEYLVIYDAEDTPDPDQLKKAFIAFERGGPQLVCVQASLNYFNSGENWLTRMFTLEYSYWFDYMLAGLDASNLPIPLGGTSNHFRVPGLLELGGWDPYNVTEDADLGIRASALGYRVGVINSTTMEEANNSIPNFIRQRSRWIKGYMQTTLVHARQPHKLIAVIGIWRFLGFALLIGGTPVSFLGVIPFYLLAAASVVVPPAWIAQVFPVWVLVLCLLNFVVGSSLMIYLSMMGPYKRGAFNLVAWAIFNPVYWVLHSIASYKGLWQLLTKPHYWEKTEHGLTAHTAD